MSRARRALLLTHHEVETAVASVTISLSQGGILVGKFLTAVILGVLLEFAAVVGVLYIAHYHSGVAESETEVISHTAIPPRRADVYREWYLQSLWDIHRDNPDNPVLAGLYRYSDTYIVNYIMPRTSEDFETTKSRILLAHGPEPTALEIHTAVTLEAHAVNRCPEWYSQICYLLDFTHWALSSEVITLDGGDYQLLRCRGRGL